MSPATRNPALSPPTLAGIAKTPAKSPHAAPGRAGELSPGAVVERIPALIAQVEGALARIQLNQLSAIPASDQSVDRWHIEIPVFCDDRFQSVVIHIERDGANKSRGSLDTWSVSLSVDLGDLGWLHARLALYGGALSATLWAEQAPTATLAGRRLEDLAKALADTGLEINSIRCHHGRPVEPAEARFDEPLLRVSA